MVVEEVIWDKKFQSAFKKIKNQHTKDRIRKQIRKIIQNPEIGKPYRYARRGERSVYIGNYRLLYSFETVADMNKLGDVIREYEIVLILAFLSKDELRREH